METAHEMTPMGYTRSGRGHFVATPPHYSMVAPNYSHASSMAYYAHPPHYYAARYGRGHFMGTGAGGYTEGADLVTMLGSPLDSVKESFEAHKKVWIIGGIVAAVGIGALLMR